MSESKRPSFGEQLLAAEVTSMELRARYEQELAKTVTTALTPRQRVKMVAGALLVLSGAAVMAGVYFLSRKPMPPVVGWVVATVAPGAALWAAAMLALAWRGRQNLRKVNIWGMAATTIILGVQAMGFLVQAGTYPDTDTSSKMTHAGLVLLGVVAGGALLTYIDDQLRVTRVKLLELEYKLAELQERMR